MFLSADSIHELLDFGLDPGGAEGGEVLLRIAVEDEEAAATAGVVARTAGFPGTREGRFAAVVSAVPGHRAEECLRNIPVIGVEQSDRVALALHSGHQLVMEGALPILLMVSSAVHSGLLTVLPIEVHMVTGTAYFPA
jgi:hypothetical protein